MGEITDVTKFVFELGQLKRVKRSGWWQVGVKDPESVAEHSYRAAILGYILGKMEGAHAERVSMMLLFHDVPEARINDLHKVGHRYVSGFKEGEKKAFSEQVKRLPKKVCKDVEEIFEEAYGRGSQEAEIARDADLLECAFSAKEYVELGHSGAKDWITNVGKYLKTKSARKLFNEMKKMDSNTWWKGLKKTER